MNDSEQRHPTHDWRQLSLILNKARSALQAVEAEDVAPAKTRTAIPFASPRIVPVRAPGPTPRDIHALWSSSDAGAASGHPARSQGLQAEPTPLSTQQGTDFTHAPRSDATVLVVEHEFNNRMLMEKILDIGGYRCLTATNGLEALAIFERERPDLILTDISMPVMDGLAATAAVRARPDGLHVPIIAVSGHALREDREHALRQGCTEYLVKPYRPHDLLTMVERLLKDRGGQL